MRRGNPTCSGFSLPRAGGARNRSTGDGSFMSVEADTALMAAEALAEWLAAGGETDSPVPWW